MLLEPTIFYPNGGEQIFDTQTVISWQNPISPNIDSIEIYFTDQFDVLKEPDWKQIAIVPGTVSQFVWNHGYSLRSDKCRIALRVRWTDGERGPFAVSARNFSLFYKKLPTPVIIEPTPYGRYDSSITIITDDAIVENGQSVFYSFYYSSVSSNVPQTLIANNVPFGANFIWNTTNLIQAKDYELQAYLVDDSGDLSDVSIVSNIQISHEGVFIIDTIPPQASIVINNNSVFSNNPTVTVNIAAYDQTTGVQSIQLIEQNGNISSPNFLTQVEYFTLSSGDGVKTLQIYGQDFGGNTIQAEPNQFQVLYNTTDSIVDIDGSWIVTAGEVNKLLLIRTDSNGLPFVTLVVTMENTPTSLVVFNDIPYISTVTPQDTGVLYRYNNYVFETVYTFTDSDSIINVGEVYNNSLYLGAENGSIYVYDGLNMTILTGTGNPVANMSSDGNLLYMTEKNGTDIYVFNGTQFILI